ncbi:MAG: hypothetical protein R3B70_46270 [Polyangiaceae bacterium]
MLRSPHRAPTLLCALGVSLAVAGSAACQPPDAIYDLTGETGACGFGSVAEIADDFNDDAKSSDWAGYADPSASLAETNQQIEMSVDGSLRAFAGYAWIGGPRSLLDCQVTLQVKQVGSTSPGILTYFSVPPADGSEGDIAFTHSGTALRMNVRAGGSDTSQGVPYDPVAHAWWRIRESAGTIHFEASADGLTWLPLFEAETPEFAGSVAVNIGMGAPDPAPQGGFAILDNLNVTP